ncbi:unnamed protein product, partial [Polarella glacialis]
AVAADDANRGLYSLSPSRDSERWTRSPSGGPFAGGRGLPQWMEHSGAPITPAKAAELRPVEARFEAIGKDMSRNAAELAAEVRALTARMVRTDSGDAADGAGNSSSSSCGMPRWLPSPPRSPRRPPEFTDWETERSMLLRQVAQLKETLEQGTVSKHEDLAQQRERQFVASGIESWDAERHKLLRQIAQQKESLEQREFELASRPSHRLAQMLRNRIAELESKLDLGSELRRSVDTRSLIRDDRRRHAFEKQRRLEGLEELRSVRREELERVLAALCTSLGVTQLGDADAALKRKLKAGPEREMADLAASKQVVEPPLPAAPAPAADSARQLRARLGQVLGCSEPEQYLPNSPSVQGAAPSEEALVARSLELIDAERRAAALAAKAEQEMKAPMQRSHSAPHVAAILRHFMQLFDVRSVEGCLPAMNTLFSRLGELTTLHSILRDQLRLRTPGGAANVAETIRALGRLERSSSAAGGGTRGRPTSAVTRRSR